MTKIRIGVVGLKFGHYLVQTLATMSDVQLVAVASRADDYPEGMDSYAAQYGVHAYTDGLQMLEQESLDAVCLSISPRRREPLLRFAAENNIALFVEKPWAANQEQARHFAKICQEQNARVMVGFSFRFHEALVKLRQLIDGELGAPWALNGEYVFDWLPDATHWLWDSENGGGFFNENSCHLFDSICYLLGEPVSVTAHTATFRASPSAEIATITIVFENGASASVMVGCLGAGALHDFPRLSMVTEHGQAQLQGKDHIWTQLTYALRGSESVLRFDTAPESIARTRYTAALQHFVDCVRTGTAPSATIQDGIRAVAIAEAVYESARSGQKVHLV
jgi:predicted dehydrogenase